MKMMMKTKNILMKNRNLNTIKLIIYDLILPNPWQKLRKIMKDRIP